MMDPPKILLETSFLRALCDPADEWHEPVVAAYLELVAQYEREEVLLVAVSDHLRELRPKRRQGPLAPVDKLPVGFQHRRVARRLLARSPSTPAEHALTLVMVERHRVRRMATLDGYFTGFDVQLVTVAAPGTEASLT